MAKYEIMAIPRTVAESLGISTGHSILRFDLPVEEPSLLLDPQSHEHRDDKADGEEAKDDPERLEPNVCGGRKVEVDLGLFRQPSHETKKTNLRGGTQAWGAGDRGDRGGQSRLGG